MALKEKFGSPRLAMPWVLFYETIKIIIKLIFIQYFTYSFDFKNFSLIRLSWPSICNRRDIPQ